MSDQQAMFEFLDANANQPFASTARAFCERFKLSAKAAGDVIVAWSKARRKR
jgi:hypothetical protein